jgi:hypothetical protein
MLAEFQKALADLTASPALVRQVRADPALLQRRYALTDRESTRLAGIAASKGMEANCMLYRANRLAPVALNLPQTCDALREQLNTLISAYWASEPTTDVHFLIEAERFARYLQQHGDLDAAALEVLAREHAVVSARLAASRAMAGASPALADDPA